MIKHLFLTCILSISISLTYSQSQLIDKIVAVVGGNIIKHSDIEQQYLEYIAKGNINKSTIRCQILDEVFYQKLLLNQAQVDSIAITDEQIDNELDRRMRYFIEQFGSEQKIEEFYNKSIVELKEDFKKTIKEQMLTQQMESKITDGVKVTPTEVKDFFKSLPADSIPSISLEVELCQIMKKPVVSLEAKTIAREKINSIRERILKGEDFATLAILYSEDPGSARKGGELGLTSKGQLYPEFEAVAFNLKSKEISPIVQTKAGYHIIQLIERQGENVNVRHILIQPQVSNDDLRKAKLKLDSVYDLLNAKKITFSEAAATYSDEDSKNNGGQIINPATGNAKFETSELDRSLFLNIEKLKANEYSQAVPMRTDDAQQAYRIVFVKSLTEPHKATLKTDYDKIQNAALNKKKTDLIDEWIKEKIKKTYINISEEYRNCTFKYNWLN